MRLVTVILAVVFLLDGCALFQEKKPERNIAAISKIKSVEIFYHDTDEIPIVEGGMAAGASGMGGLFGPLGSLVGAAVDVANGAASKERTATRSAAFTKALKESVGDINFNENFARQLADKLRSKGLSVKLTKYQRPVEDGKLEDNNFANIKSTQGYAVLILRITAGYGAPSSTSSYQTLLINEAVLKDEQGQVLAKYNATDRDFGPSYMTFNGLLGERVKAAGVLKTELMSKVELEYNDLLSIPPAM